MPECFSAICAVQYVNWRRRQRHIGPPGIELDHLAHRGSRGGMTIDAVAGDDAIDVLVGSIIDFARLSPSNEGARRAQARHVEGDRRV